MKLGSKFARLLFPFVLLTSTTVPVLANEGFPLREKFSKLKIITTEELNHQFDSVTIVDVRSTVEYKVIHVQDAILLPLSRVSFVPELRALRAKAGPTRLIVLYCNGHTCAKSYEAAEKARVDGIPNVAVYDSGVFDWVKAFPERGVFFGKSPVDRSQLLSEAQIKAKTLSKSEFLAKATESNSLVIDVRDPVQRKELPPIKSVRNIPMDELVTVLKQKRLKESGKFLLFLDAVGHQNQWLQYYLEKFGYTNYAFLKGGMEAFKN